MERLDFKKRAHRPWKNNLEQHAVAAPLKLEKEPSAPRSLPNLVKPEALFSQKVPPFGQNHALGPQPVNFPRNVPIAANTDDKAPSASNLQNVIAHKMEQKQQLSANLNAQKSGPMLIGGFLNPDCLAKNPEEGNKMRKMMQELKVRQQELETLSTNLKMTQVAEELKTAETARHLAEEARFSAEERLKKVMEQTELLLNQLGIATEKAALAEEALHEEEHMRRRLTVNNQELDNKLKEEQALRISLEEKMQYAMKQVMQVDLARQELERERQLYESFLANMLADKDRGLLRYATTEQKLTLIVQERREWGEKTARLQELEQNARAMEEAIALQKKLEGIIATERKLRAIAEQKAKEAEIARAAEEKQRQLLDERARRAILHANQTVMNFLNSPVDSLDLNLKMPESSEL